jgi:conjugative relaxase-like TrwC/TraI family protein
LTVTALGSTGGRPLAAVVGDITEYLMGATTDPPGPDDRMGPPAGDGGGLDGGRSVPEQGPGRYYADSAEEPGRWIGQGSGELGLTGTVQPEAFRSVLAGRDPRNGARLITARGSAGRVRDLGAGTATQWSPDGEALYAPGDVAAVLGWSRADVDDAITEGERLAAEHLVAALTTTVPGTNDTATRPDGTGDAPPDLGMALVPFVRPDGSRAVPERELTRLEALVTASRSHKGLRAAGEAGEELSAPEAARMVGTSRSYLARLCRTYAEHRNEIDQALAAGTTPKRSYVVCRQDEAGDWRITRDALAAYADRRRQPAVRVGYDITATTEKSISVLALLGGPDVRRAVLEAIESANDTAMGWLEHHAASARAGGKAIGATGWTAASFRHLSSRRLDPFVHHHNVVANTAVDENGDRRALDARRLYRHVAAASALATAQVRYELTARLGVGFRPARRGGWEIAGIDDPVLDEFSQRSREINETIRELEDAIGRTTTLGELRSVVATSRPARATVDNETALVDSWWTRARAHGLTPDTIHRLTGQVAPSRLTRVTRAAILDRLAGAVSEERSVFTRGDVLAALVNLEDPASDGGPLIVPAAELERLADDFVAGPAVVALAASTGRADVLRRSEGSDLAVGGDAEIEYTTTEILAIQDQALRHYAAGATDGGQGRVDTSIVDEVLARFPELSDEQRQLVTRFCRSGHGAQSAIGRPGTGKTHAMRAAVTAWQTAGYRVLGTAVKAEAARHLGEQGTIPAEPLAWYTARFDDPARSPLDARTVLIVDEASTIGDRDLNRLLTAAATAGATVRFIGDPFQHGSVTAGGLWRVITDRFADHVPELSVGRRVRHHADRQAAEALRDGRPADALDALDAAGHLHLLPNERELYAALLAHWWNSREAGRPHPMVDRRNDQRLVLNRLARQVRRQMGELGDAEITAAGGRRFSVGDEVIARMGTRHLHPHGRPDAYVRNGAHGTVTAVHPHPTDPGRDRMTVDFAGLGTIEVPRKFFDEHTDEWGRVEVGIDHGYAITSYAVEGLTHDASASHVDSQSTRPEVYVDITRGRDANHLYLTAAADPLEGERLPAVPADGEQQQLADRLARSGAETPAIDLDPLAGPAAHHARRHTLAQLHRQARSADDRDLRTLATHAERIRERRIARRATTRPDPHLTGRLIARPAEAFLAARYDQLIVAMAIYRARWEPTPGRTGHWDWALGQSPPDPDAADERAQLVTDLERFAVRVVAHHLPHGQQHLDNAARDAVHHLAATGAIGRVAPTDLARIIHDTRSAGFDPAEVRRLIIATVPTHTAPSAPAASVVEDAGVG